MEKDQYPEDEFEERFVTLVEPGQESHPFECEEFYKASLEDNDKKGLINYYVKVRPEYKPPGFSIMPSAQGFKTESFASLGLKFLNACQICGMPALPSLPRYFEKTSGFGKSKSHASVSITIPNTHLNMPRAMMVHVNPLFSINYHFLFANKLYAELLAKMNGAEVVPMVL